MDVDIGVLVGSWPEYSKFTATISFAMSQDTCLVANILMPQGCCNAFFQESSSAKENAVDNKATAVIGDGQTVLVDGFRGEVILEPQE